MQCFHQRWFCWVLFLEHGSFFLLYCEILRLMALWIVQPQSTTKSKRSGWKCCGCCSAISMRGVSTALNRSMIASGINGIRCSDRRINWYCALQLMMFGLLVFICCLSIGWVCHNLNVAMVRELVLRRVSASCLLAAMTSSRFRSSLATCLARSTTHCARSSWCCGCLQNFLYFMPRLISGDDGKHCAMTQNCQN